jgi:uncharacterized protein YuzE
LVVKYDPEADAVYVELAPPDPAGGEQTVTEGGVIVDHDRRGLPRGFEFLSVRSRGIPLEGLPPAVVAALEAFIASGALEASGPVARQYP